MRKSGIIGKAAVVAAILLAGVSCRYKDLEIGILRNVCRIVIAGDGSDTYRVILWPEDEETAQSFTKGYVAIDVPKEGTEVNLPVGNYSITAYNTDTEHVIVNGPDGDRSIRATTPTSSSLSISNIPAIMDSLYRGQQILDYPDYMEHANIPHFQVVEGDQPQLLVIRTDSMTVDLHIRVSGIGGLSEAAGVKGSLNNVAAKRYINEEDKSEGTAVVLFDCYVDDEGCVCADITLFGLEPTDINNLDHSLVLYFYMPDRNKYLVIDVTDKVAAAKGDDSVTIDEDKTGVDLREFTRGASNFQLNVEEWKDEEEIILGF